MVRHGRLADVAAGGEVARADLGAVAQLAQDREAGGVGGGLEEQDVGIGLALHPTNVLTDVYIVKYQYSHHVPSRHRGARATDDHRDHPRERSPALRRCRGPRLPRLLVLQRSRDHRRQPLLRARARRAAGRRGPRVAGLRQPDRRRRPPSRRAGPGPRVRRRHRRPAVRQAGRPDRSRLRRRHDRRDARPRAGERRPGRGDQRRVPQGPHRGASRSRPSRSTS